MFRCYLCLLAGPETHREKGRAFFFIPFPRLHGTKATFRIRLLLTINMPFLPIVHIIFHLFGANKTSIFMPFADTDRMHSLSFRSNWKCHHILERCCCFFFFTGLLVALFCSVIRLTSSYFSCHHELYCVCVFVCLYESLFVYLFELYLRSLFLSACLARTFLSTLHLLVFKFTF